MPSLQLNSVALGDFGLPCDARLVYTSTMDKLLYNLRSTIARLLGIKSREAQDGRWWEMDFLVVVLIGSAILGVAAFLG
jgi:hypothetical protein